MSLLELRSRIKSRKPFFVRQSAHKEGRLDERWRRPKGLHSKMRIGKKGHPRSVEPGWGSPRAVRGFHRSGLLPVVVSSVDALSVLDKKLHGVIISSAVGNLKRIALLDGCGKLGLRVLNIRDSAGFVKAVQEGLARRKQERLARVKGRDQKAKERQKKSEPAAPKDELSAKIEAEEKKEQEKREMEKVLTGVKR